MGRAREGKMLRRPALSASIAVAALLAGPFVAETQTPTAAQQEAAAIEAAARDYIEGWFDGDEQRMERALWRGLAKRVLATELGIDQVDVVETTALELVQQTRAKAAEPRPAELEVVILDRTENAASVRVDAGRWIDYLHLVKLGDRWKIVNVLWEIKSSANRGEGGD